MDPEFGVTVECAIIQEECKIYRTPLVQKYKDFILKYSDVTPNSVHTAGNKIMSHFLISQVYEWSTRSVCLNIFLMLLLTELFCS
jgi:hypothetical protein